MACTEKARVVPVLSKRDGLKSCLDKLLPHIEFKEIYPDENEDDLQILKISEIIISDPNRICPFLHELINTRWIQGTWAGVDLYRKHIDKNKPKFPFKITRYTGPTFGYQMGEYVMSQIVIYERDFFKIHQNQSKRLWVHEGKIFDYRTLADLTVGILGFGAIGKEIAHMLKAFHAKVWVLVRSVPSELEKLSYVDEYRKVDELPELLSSCDYVCNVLPSTDNTKGLLGNGMLKHCYGRGTVFINIGRGSIITEKELVEALNKKWISGAILDVFEGEPLAPSSPLWPMPQVSITPHVSGVMKPQDIAQVFAKNLELYESGQPLEYLYDIERGY